MTYCKTCLEAMSAPLIQIYTPLTRGWKGHNNEVCGPFIEQCLHINKLSKNIFHHSYFLFGSVMLPP